MRKGDVLQGELTLTNYGLVRADDVKASLPAGDAVEQTIRDLHRMCRGQVWDAGEYKQKEGDIIEARPIADLNQTLDVGLAWRRGTARPASVDPFLAVAREQRHGGRKPSI